MEIRKTTLEDMDEILRVYDIGRKLMRASGNMNQWIKGYPSRELLTGDIEKGNSYVVTDDGRIIAVFTFILGEDPTYRVIDGAWLNDRPYGVIHRIGSDGSRKGILAFVLDYVFQRTDNIKIDTHRDNKIMQACLAKNGFTYCGVIVIEDGTERVAFQRVK